LRISPIPKSSRPRSSTCRNFSDHPDISTPVDQQRPQRAHEGRTGILGGRASRRREEYQEITRACAGGGTNTPGAVHDQDLLLGRIPAADPTGLL
jgi:hypothetical protein